MFLAAIVLVIMMLVAGGIERRRVVRAGVGTTVLRIAFLVAFLASSLLLVASAIALRALIIFWISLSRSLIIF